MMMKITGYLTACIGALLILCSNNATAQDKRAEKSYKEGSIWYVSLIKTKAYKGEEYMKVLGNTIVKIDQEAQNQGLLLSFKVLWGDASSPGDWDIMLLEEYKNMAALDGLDDKFNAIMKKVAGDVSNNSTQVEKNLAELRELYGSKLMRQVNFNK